MVINERRNTGLVIFRKPLYSSSNIFLIIGGNMRGWKWRLSQRLYSIGFKYHIVWMMSLGDSLRKSSMKEYI